MNVVQVRPSVNTLLHNLHNLWFIIHFDGFFEYRSYKLILVENSSNFFNSSKFNCSLPFSLTIQ